MSSLVGKLDTISAIFDDNTSCNDPFMQVLQEDFGFLRNDQIMVISQKGTHFNGASIPRWFWPILGSPLELPNSLWSCAHDSAYRGTVVVINCRNLFPSMSPQRILRVWRELKSDSMFIHRDDLGRKWFDENLMQCMECCKEPWLKRKTVYRMLRIFGGLAWKKNKLDSVNK